MNLNKLKTDRKGSVEGLPLQFMIMMIVAVAAVGILSGWMAGIEAPHSISDVEVISAEGLADVDGNIDPVSVRVRDQDGNPLKDATVYLSGLGIRNADGGKALAYTNDDGIATLDNLVVTPPRGSFGTVTVNVMKTGYGEHCSTEFAVISYN
jgi:hypothetical protein